MTENNAEAILVLMLVTTLWGSRIHLNSGLLENARKRPDIEKFVLLALTVLTLGFFPVMDALGPFFEFADLRFSDEVAWAGLIIGGAAIALLLQAQADLARYHAGSSRTRERMPEEGVYRYMRHPFYAAMLLWSVAQLLLLQNWIAGPAAGLTFLVVYLLRMPCEEEAQLRRFGHHYLDYMGRTGRLLPRFNRLRK